jgi:hypothetical protein
MTFNFRGASYVPWRPGSAGVRSRSAHAGAYSLVVKNLLQAQIMVALARPFGRQPQTVAEFELGLDVVALQPVQSF